MYFAAAAFAWLFVLAALWVAALGIFLVQQKMGVPMDHRFVGAFLVVGCIICAAVGGILLAGRVP